MMHSSSRHIRHTKGGKPSVISVKKHTENEMKHETEKDTLGHKVPNSTDYSRERLGKGNSIYIYIL